jgi:hypothetical protein
VYFLDGYFGVERGIAENLLRALTRGIPEFNVKIGDTPPCPNPSRIKSIFNPRL